MSNITCPSHNFYVAAQTVLNIGTYKVITPIYFLFGLIGHVLCLMSFYRQSKVDKGYQYQFFVTASETVEIITYGVYSLASWYFSGMVWFKSSYILMWYMAHVTIQQLNMAITTSLLLSVSMVTDRLIALIKPLIYKDMNHNRHQALAVTICVILGIGSSMFDCFRAKVIVDRNTGLYAVVTDLNFLASTPAYVFAQLRNLVRLLALVVLVLGNIIMIVLYKRRNKRVASMTGDLTRIEKKRRDAENTLIVLSIFQSTFTSVSILAVVTFYGALYFMPGFTSCEMPMWIPLLDGTIQVMDMVNFYVVVIVSRKFRRIMTESLPWLSRLVSIRSHKSSSQQSHGQDVNATT